MLDVRGLIKSHLQGSTDVIWVTIGTQVIHIFQLVQNTVCPTFTPASDACLYSGLNWGLRLPHSNISTITKRLNSIA